MSSKARSDEADNAVMLDAATDKASKSETGGMADTRSANLTGDTKSNKDKKPKAKAKLKATVSGDVQFEQASGSAAAASFADDARSEGGFSEGPGMIDIRSLRVPDSIKKLLLELSMENTGDGGLTEQTLVEALSMMQALKRGLDVDGRSGTWTKAVPCV